MQIVLANFSRFNVHIKNKIPIAYAEKLSDPVIADLNDCEVFDTKILGTETVSRSEISKHIAAMTFNDKLTTEERN